MTVHPPILSMALSMIITTLTFPIDAVPISGKFEAVYFLPDHWEGTADVVPPPVIDHPHGKTEC
jgi:hypothetical protein